MLFSRKIASERQTEIRLSVLQLNKLITRAVDNINDAISAFDTSYENLHASEKELSKSVAYITEFMSVGRFIKKNEEVLLEIEAILKDKQLRVPSIIKENLKNVKKKNYHALIMFNTHNQFELDRTDNVGLEIIFANAIIVKQNFRDELVQLSISLSDFLDLFGKQFSTSLFDYVHENRFKELDSIVSSDFDLSKLIRLCEELNNSFQNKNYLSVAMLVRAILDHVPPVFGCKTFVEVANNYGGKSLKKSLSNLQNSSRNIADAYLHEAIRSKESLPNETQIDFRNDLDVLLSEIIRILK